MTRQLSVTWKQQQNPYHDDFKGLAEHDSLSRWVQTLSGTDNTTEIEIDGETEKRGKQYLIQRLLRI